MHAQVAYQFTHAMLREVAYQLQLPGDRAHLHGIVHDLLEGEPDVAHDLAFDLAEHARLAALEPALSEERRRHLELAEMRHLERAAVAARRGFRNQDTYAILLRLAQHSHATTEQKLQALYGLAAVCLTLGRNDQAAGFGRQCIKLSANAEPAIQADALSQAGIVFAHMHLVDDAEICFTQAFAAAQSSGNKAALCSLLGGWSTVKQHRKDWPAAARLLEQALSLAHELNDLGQITHLTTNRGILYYHQGQLDDAEKIYEQLLVAAVAANNLSTQCTVVGNLGTLRNAQGRWGEATVLLKKAIGLAHTLGDRRRELVHLGNLAVSAKKVGRRIESRAIGLEAISMARETGDNHALSLNAGNLAILLHEEHYYDEAHAAYLEALQAAYKMGDGHLIGMWQCYLSLLGTLSGDTAMEARYAASARETYSALGKPKGLAYYDEMHKATADERDLVVEFTPQR